MIANDPPGHASLQQQQVDFRPLEAWLNWGLAVLFVILVFTFQTGYAITNHGVQADLRLSVTQIGLIGSIYTWAFALTQILSGSILDRLGIRWVLPAAAAVVSIGGLVFAHATNLQTLIAGQVLMATGGAFGFIGAGYAGGAWFGALKYGVMFSWVQFVSCLAAIAGQRTLGGLVETVSWTDLMAGMAWAGIVLSVVMCLMMKNPGSNDRVGFHQSGFAEFLRSLYTALAEVLSIRDTWINAIIGGATFGSMLALGVVWGPKFLLAAGMTQADAIAVSSTMWAGLALGAPAFMWFSNFLRSRKSPVLIGCALQLMTIEAIVFLPEVSPVVAAALFFSWGFMAGASMLNFAVGADIVRESLTGTSAAIVNAVQFVTGGVVMVIPGWVLALLDANRSLEPVGGVLQRSLIHHQLALLIFPVVLLIALFLFPLYRETYPRASR